MFKSRITCSVSRPSTLSAAADWFVDKLRRWGLRQFQHIHLDALEKGAECGSRKPGTSAPDFTLPRIGGGECSLSDHRGRRVLVAFVETGCERSHDIAREFNRLQRSKKLQVLAISRGARQEAALWADDVLAAFPVLVASAPNVSIEYGVPDTPFACVVDEQGQIVESGMVSRRGRSGFKFRSPKRGPDPAISAVPVT